MEVALAMKLDGVDLKLLGADDEGRGSRRLHGVLAADVAPHLVEGWRVAKEPELFQPLLLEAANPSASSGGKLRRVFW